MNKSRSDALKSLKKRLNDANSLIICDPYIFSQGKSGPEIYIVELLNVLPSTLLSLSFVYSGEKNNLSILREIECKMPSTKVSSFRCDEIHDRVWIIDDKSVFVTGTSFNSIGSRLSFILDLDKDDTNSFLKFIKNIIIPDL